MVTYCVMKDGKEILSGLNVIEAKDYILSELEKYQIEVMNTDPKHLDGIMKSLRKQLYSTNDILFENQNMGDYFLTVKKEVNND